MLNSLIKFALNRRPLVLFLYIIVSTFGVYTLSKLPVDVLPDLNRPRVTVFAEAEGMSAEDVEKIRKLYQVKNVGSPIGYVNSRSLYYN